MKRRSNNNKKRDETTPIACSKEHPCQVCGGIKHPCYWTGTSILCAIGGNPPPGYEPIENALSGQYSYVKAVATAGDPVVQPDDLRKTIDWLIAEDLSRSQLESYLPDLARQNGRTAQDIWRLYRSRQSEIEQTESRDSRSLELNQILKIASTELDLHDYISLILADPLQKIAEIMGSNGAAMLTTLLPIAATLLQVGTRLELVSTTNFYALPILYTGILAESGSAKSPTQKTLLTPLFRLQAKADEDYNERLEIYEEAKERSKQNKDTLVPVKPKNREYYTCDSTREAIALIQSQQPERGFLGWFDELSGLIHGQNQYRNGRGTDKESILSGRDGTGIKVNRASGKRLSAPHSAYSITGSTQPDTLRQLVGDFSDPTGQWARFLWATLPIKPAPFPVDMPSYNIDDLLYGVYKRLEAFAPHTYTLSTEARSVYAQWYNALDAKRLSEPQQGLRAVYAKMKGDTGILALLLHCLNAAIEGETPVDRISLQTMQAAIALSRYYLGQVRLIHSEGGQVDKLQDYCQRLIKISQRQGWISARETRNNDRCIRSELKDLDEIRSLFRELAAMGIGELSGEGRSLRWRYLPPLDNFTDSVYLSTNGNHKQQNPDISSTSTDSRLSTNCLQTASTNEKNSPVSTNPPDNHQKVDKPKAKVDGAVDIGKTNGNRAGQGFGRQSADFVDSRRDRLDLRGQPPPLIGGTRLTLEEIESDEGWEDCDD